MGKFLKFPPFPGGAQCALPDYPLPRICSPAPYTAPLISDSSMEWSIVMIGCTELSRYGFPFLTKIDPFFTQILNVNFLPLL